MYVSPCFVYTGYGVAANTVYFIIYNNRHYINDVIAGACIGITSVKLTYWLYSKCFKKAKCNKATFASVPYYSLDGWGMNMCIVF